MGRRNTFVQKPQAVELNLALNELAQHAATPTLRQSKINGLQSQTTTYILNHVLAENNIFRMYQFLNNAPDRLPLWEGSELLEGYEAGNCDVFAVRKCTGFENGQPVYEDKPLLFESASLVGRAAVYRAGPPNILNKEFQNGRIGYVVGRDFSDQLVYNTLVAATMKAQKGAIVAASALDEVLVAEERKLSDELDALATFVKKYSS